VRCIIISFGTASSSPGRRAIIPSRIWLIVRPTAAFGRRPSGGRLPGGRSGRLLPAAASSSSAEKTKTDLTTTLGMRATLHTFVPPIERACARRALLATFPAGVSDG
jgi:hypothetical protein